jgi:hypothetical protein
MADSSFEHLECPSPVRGADVAGTLPGFYPYFDVVDSATYQQVQLSPDVAYVVGGHYSGLSHVVDGGAAEVIMAIGQGVGDSHRSQHAVFLSQDYPPQAIVYERIDTI